MFFGVMPRLASALPIAAGCVPPGTKMKMRFGVGVLGALHERREIRIGDGHPHRPDDLAAARLERADEGGFGVQPGTVVGHQRVRPS